MVAAAGLKASKAMAVGAMFIAGTMAPTAVVASDLAPESTSAPVSLLVRLFLFESGTFSTIDALGSVSASIGRDSASIFLRFLFRVFDLGVEVTVLVNLSVCFLNLFVAAPGTSSSSSCSSSSTFPLAFL